MFTDTAKIEYNMEIIGLIPSCGSEEMKDKAAFESTKIENILSKTTYCFNYPTSEGIMTWTHISREDALDCLEVLEKETDVEAWQVLIEPVDVEGNFLTEPAAEFQNYSEAKEWVRNKRGLIPEGNTYDVSLFARLDPSDWETVIEATLEKGEGEIAELLSSQLNDEGYQKLFDKARRSLSY